MIAESITAFVAVVDRLISLADRREKLNRNTFTDFVAPVMSDFEAVHKNYIECFGDYLTAVADHSIPFSVHHPLLDKIRNDSVLSQYLRMKALEITSQPCLDPRMLPFAQSLEEYFGVAEGPLVKQSGRHEDFRSRFIRCNLARRIAYSQLSEIARKNLPDAQKRTLATEALILTLGGLQTRYDAVFSKFNELKTKLLSPI